MCSLRIYRLFALSTTHSITVYRPGFISARVPTQSSGALQVINYSLSPLAIAENMMCIQLTRKALITYESPLISMPISLLPRLPFNKRPHLKFPIFCTQIAASSPGPPERDDDIEFILHKCGLTDEDITKAFKRIKSCQGLLCESSERLEEVLELFNECGLTTPEEIRRVVLWNPRILLYKSQRNLKSRISFLKEFMKVKDIARLVYTDSKIFNYSENKLKSAISALQGLGVEGDALSELVARAPRLLMISEEKIMESFKQTQDFGFKKGSKMFAYALRVILAVGKDNIDRKLRCLSSLGLSEKQILAFWRQQPMILALSEEKLKSNVYFLVNSVGYPLDTIVRYPSVLAYSLEKRIIPRYTVIQALKSLRILKKRVNFPEVIKLSERRFLEQYVNSNAELSSVMLDIYNGAKAGKFIIGKETYSERLLSKAELEML